MKAFFTKFTCIGMSHIKAKTTYSSDDPVPIMIFQKVCEVHMGSGEKQNTLCMIRTLAQYQDQDQDRLLFSACVHFTGGGESRSTLASGSGA